MKNMERVVRYRCGWCGKEFKTPDRHICRWDPDCKNCLSCKHRGKRVDDVDNWVAFECPHFEDPCEAPCDFSKGAVAKEGNNCSHWELIEGYKGKQTFAKIEAEREGEYESPAELMEAAERGREPPSSHDNDPFPF
jgi:hypothetical protein